MKPCGFCLNGTKIRGQFIILFNSQNENGVTGSHVGRKFDNFVHGPF